MTPAATTHLMETRQTIGHGRDRGKTGAVASMLWLQRLVSSEAKPSGMDVTVGSPAAIAYWGLPVVVTMHRPKSPEWPRDTSWCVADCASRGSRFSSAARLALRVAWSRGQN